MFSSSKPYTAITVYVDRLTGPEYQENDYSGIVDLIEVIRIQASGPTEAARAIRKKLKYGDTHRQLRALTILDGLIENAGDRFQRAFADEPLLERLRQLPREIETVDPRVREKCNVLFKQWSSRYKSQPGMTSIASLYKDLPKKSRMTASQSRVVQENERDLDHGNPFADTEDEEPPAPTTRRKSSVTQSSSFASSSPSFRGHSYLSAMQSNTSSAKKDKKSKRKPFNLEKEKPNIMQAIASASVASTNLLNALKFVDRETTRISESQDVMNRFEICKQLRRQILRYIHLIESEQWIGSLLSANDELVKSLMAFEIMDKSVDDDSDSETETLGASSAAAAATTASPAHARKPSKVETDLAGLSFEEKPPAKPPRPGSTAPPPTKLPPPPPIPPSAAAKHNDSDNDADENDPFGDQNEIGA